VKRASRDGNEESACEYGVLAKFASMRRFKYSKDGTGIASVEKSSGYFPAIIVRAIANLLIVTS
jgi:hypothetical protein